MSDTPDPKPILPSVSTRFISRRRLERPAIFAIAGGLLVMVVAVALWLLPARENAEAARLRALESRLATMEAAPRAGTADPGPAQQRLAAALTVLEGRLTALEQRPVADHRLQDSLSARVAAVEPRVAELLARPAPDAAALAQLAARSDRLFERLEAQSARLQASDTEAARRAEEVARVAGERLGAAQQAVLQRLTEQERAQITRIAALETMLAQRLATLEEGQQRLAALEERARRMAAYDSLAARLAAGQPLAPALSGMQSPPPALARFAETAPPTEAALRLSFEDAARAARAASEPVREGQGMAESALARLSGLVTVRRGEEVVWGDAAAADIERARRALEAGDLDGALTRLARLPTPARDAMRPWTEQASSLSAARAALRALAAG